MTVLRLNKPCDRPARKRFVPFDSLRAITSRAFIFSLLMLVGILTCNGQNGIAFQYFYDDLGQLIRVADSSGNVVTYTYDPAGNCTAITRTALSSPTALAVFNFTPHRGTAGTTVTLLGQGFDPTAANDTVQFNGKAASISSATATTLVVTVPSGATSGPVSVTVAGTTAQGDTFTVLPLLTSIAISPANPSFAIGPPGMTQQFTATGSFDNGSTQDLTTSATWSSSNLAVATIRNALGSQGLAQILTTGTTTITATSGSIVGTSTVTVTPPVLSSIAVSPVNPSIPVNSSVQFAATGTLSNGSSQDVTTSVTWTSSNTAVATISNASGSQGLVSVLTTGPTTITASLNSISGSTTLTGVSGAAGQVGRFLYATGEQADFLSIFTIDEATGELRDNGYLSDINWNSAMAVDVPGGFLFAEEVVFANNTNNFFLQPFSVNPANGSLTPTTGTSIPIPNNAPLLWASVDHAGHFLFTIPSGSSQVIDVYAIDPTTGGLTAVPGSPFTVSGAYTIYSGAVHPSGKFLYAGGGGSAIYGFSIDPVTGALTPLAGSPFGTKSGSSPLGIDPLGKFLYSGNAGSGGGLIYAFTINSTTGALTPVAGSPFSAGTVPPAEIEFHSSGKFVYSMQSYGAAIYAYSIDPVSGALTAIQGSPFPAAGGLSESHEALDPSGKFLYTGFQQPAVISTYSVDPGTGILTLLETRQNTGGGVYNGPVIFSGAAPVTYTPTFAYIANSGDNSISGYAIDPANGALTAVPGSPFAAGTTPDSVTTDPAGRFLFAANSGSNSISVYTIGAQTGALTPVAGSPFATGSGPTSLAVDATGSFVYSVNTAQKNFSGFTISPTGTLTSLSCNNSTGGTNPTSLAMEPAGFLNYTTDAASNTLFIGAIEPFLNFPSADCPGGTLSVTTDTAPSAVVVHPSSTYVYVANSGSNDVSGFLVNSNTSFGAQTLTPITGQPFAAGTIPMAVAADPLGRFLYVANQGSNNVSAYTVSKLTGVLTPTNGSPFAVGTAPSSVTVDVSGQFVYVTNSGSNNVSVFSINPATGALTPVAGSPFPTGGTPLSVTTTGTIK